MSDTILACDRCEPPQVLYYDAPANKVRCRNCGRSWYTDDLKTPCDPPLEGPT